MDIEEIKLPEPENYKEIIEEADKLPLSLGSAMVLAKKFGSSNHAAIRRYVERSAKRCAVLVLERPELMPSFAAKVRNYFQSAPFTAAFGQIEWPQACDEDYPFIADLKAGNRLHHKGELAVDLGRAEQTAFRYHFFNNSYNAFVLLLPQGERNFSRTKIVVSGASVLGGASMKRSGGRGLRRTCRRATGET